MMQVLEDSVSSYPFIKIILDKIQGDPVMKTRIFSTFRKDFQPYGIQQYDPTSNTIETFIVNRNTSVESVLNTIKSTLDSNTVLHPNAYYNAKN